MYDYNRHENRIGEAREAAGLTQKQLADMLGTTTVSIFNWEKGRQELKASVLIGIANATGRSIEYILGLDGAEDKAPSQLTPQEQHLVNIFRSLDETQRGMAIGYVQRLSDERAGDGPQCVHPASWRSA